MMKNQVFKILGAVEKLTAYMQGKGMGASSITKEIQTALGLLNQKPELVIDIGGNIGNYTAEIERYSPTCEVHVFEPSSVNIKKLNQRFAKNQKIVILPEAVSDFAGEATLFSDEPGSGLGSLSQRNLDHLGIDFKFKEPVKVSCLEKYWTESLDGRIIDLVKIDIEGYELAALRGFGNSINSIRVIQFEFGGCNIDTRTYFQDFWLFFTKNDFDLYRITPLGKQRIENYNERDEYFSTTNYLAVNKCLIK